MRRRLAVVSVALFVIVVSMAIPPPASAYCERCIEYCYPPYYFCEYACEVITGFCPNCFVNCRAYYDLCSNWTPCYWADHTPVTLDPAEQLLAQVFGPALESL